MKTLKDYFSVSSTTYPALLIASSADSEDIHVQVLDTKNFILQGTTKCRSGHAVIKVQTHADNWCLLDIKDGPFNFYPRISASCNGLRYLNTTYEGRKTHAYTIYFE